MTARRAIHLHNSGSLTADNYYVVYHPSTNAGIISKGGALHFTTPTDAATHRHPPHISKGADATSSDIRTGRDINSHTSDADHVKAGIASRTTMLPSRPHRIHLPCPKMQQTPPQQHENSNNPNVVESDEDYLVLHRYPLRSQLQANAIVQPVRDALLNVEECNTVIDKITGNVQEYRH